MPTRTKRSSATQLLTIAQTRRAVLQVARQLRAANAQLKDLAKRVPCAEFSAMLEFERPFTEAGVIRRELVAVTDLRGLLEIAYDLEAAVASTQAKLESDWRRFTARRQARRAARGA